MTKVQELLERRAEGWESDEEEAGEGLYYTEKQTRVFKAIVENRDANIKEVADTAGVHPSYVRYIVNRLPKDKATDEEWLMEKAGVDPEDLEGSSGTEEEPQEESAGDRAARSEAEAPPEQTALEEQVGADSLMESFGVASAEDVEEVNLEEGAQVSMVRYLPVTITVTIPKELLMEEEGGEQKLLMTPDQLQAPENSAD